MFLISGIHIGEFMTASSWAKIDDISKMFSAELSEEYDNSPCDKKSAVL